MSEKLPVILKRVRKCREGEYDPAEYLPVSKFKTEDMMKELLELVGSVKNPYLQQAFWASQIQTPRDGQECSVSVHWQAVQGILLSP